MHRAPSRHSSRSFADSIKWQRNKLFCLALIFAASTGFASGLVVLLVPHWNDALSGTPDYLSAIANATAEALVKQLSGLYPVLVTKTEQLDCPPIQSSVPASNIYYVIRFSDIRHRLCVTKYADPAPKNKGTEIISEQTGRNFGPRLPSSRRVVAIGQNVVDFPDTFLSTLHWRQSTEESTTGPDQDLIHNLQGLSVDIMPLKAEVSRKHRRLTRGLLCGIGLSLLAMILTSRRLRVQFVSSRQHFSLYAGSLTFTTYLLRDLGREFAKVRISCVDKLEHTHSMSRTERIVRRRHEETRRALAACLEILTEEERRCQIHNSLIEDDLDTMQSLLETIEGHANEPSPSVRLSSLLEYLKEYCSDAEFESFRVEAASMMQRHGFRSARKHVVNIRKDLQMRARQAEQEELQAAGPQPRTADDRTAQGRSGHSVSSSELDHA
jgi:hypothetical protein